MSRSEQRRLAATCTEHRRACACREEAWRMLRPHLVHLAPCRFKEGTYPCLCTLNQRLAALGETEGA